MKILENSYSTEVYSKSAYQAEIDGLRAFAVTAVIINHFCKEILPGGYLGVDIFFVISGFVITSSIAGRPATTFINFLLDFVVRRIKRLVPALALFVLILSLLISMFSPDSVLPLRTGIFSLFGLSNLYLLKQATDYFGTSSELNVFTHTWSLGVEEQFYIFFPFILWFTGFSSRTVNGVRNFHYTIAILSALSLVAFIYLYKINQPAAYYLMPTRFWELGCGSLLFLSLKKSNKITRIMKGLPSYFVIIAIMGVLCMPPQYAIQSTVSIVILTSILITSLRPQTFAYRLFTQSSVVYIGKISYSLYLWHWGVLALSRWTIGITPWTVPLQITLMLALAISSYKYVEVPLRKAQWSPNRWKSIGTGVCLLSTTAITVTFLLFWGRHSLYLGVPKHKEISAALVASTTDQKTIFESEIGTVLLVGDSHAGHFSQMIKEVAKELNLNYKLVSNGATAFPTVSISTPAGGLTFNRNKSHGKELLSSLEQNLKRFQSTENDLVILSSFYRFYFQSPSGSRQYQVMTHYNDEGRVITKNESLLNWLDRLEQFAAENTTKSIIIILSTPEMPGIYPESICTKEWFRAQPSAHCQISIHRKEVIEELSILNAKITEKALKIPNVFIFDPTPALCHPHNTYCESHENGKRLFSDEDHLSHYGSMRVKEDFLEFLVEHRLAP